VGRIRFISLFLFPTKAKSRVLIEYKHDSLELALNACINSPFQSSLVFIKNKKVLVDSLPLKSVHVIEKDSTVVLTFTNNTFRIFKPNEFWGEIKGYGERRRFYKGKMFTVWRTNPPYIYKIYNKEICNFNYFFSLTLSDEIFILNTEMIDKSKADSSSKNWLKNYIKENELDIININHPPFIWEYVKEDTQSFMFFILEVINLYGPPHHRNNTKYK
jgi:hypothetical protein